MQTTARTPEELHGLLEDAFNRADPDAFVAAFEPGATMLSPPDGHVARGHAEIRQAIEPVLARRPTATIEVVATVPGDGLAMTHARWRLDGMAGRGTIVSRRQPDGSWLIVLDNPLSPD
jgi:ketosteroid isomerase-like protein